MAYAELTKKKLFTLSGNQCAFPDCTHPIFDTEHDVMVGEICHIKARSKNGPRYDANQTQEERDGYDNLILMYGAHNKIIDNTDLVDKFPVGLLREYKKLHEDRFKNTVVKPDLLNHWMDLHSWHEWPRFRSIPGFPIDMNFHGRSDKRLELTEWLTRRGPHGASPILQLVGIGGIGKSNLSWLWAKHDVGGEDVPVDRIQLERSSDSVQQTEPWVRPLRIIWFSFYSHEGGGDFRGFLDEALTHLSAGTLGPEYFSLQKTRDYGAIQRAVLNTLITHRSLVVWDGAERLLNEYASGDPALHAERSFDTLQDRPAALKCRDLAVSQFLWEVTAQSTSKLLIVSRLPFADLDDKAAGLLELSGLDPEAAVRVLQKRGVTGPTALLDAAASEYEYHPLSLGNLAASLQVDFERQGDISGCRPLDPAMPQDERRQHVFDLAFRRRDPSRRHLLSRLSRVRGEITREVIKLLSKDVPGLIPSELGKNLAELCRHGLLRKRTDSDAYDFHPVIRKYIYDREEYANERRDVHGQLAKYYQQRTAEVSLSSVNDVHQLVPWFEYFYHTARSGEAREAFKIFKRGQHPTVNTLLYFDLCEHLIFINLLEELLPKDDDSPNPLNRHELGIVANDMALAYSHIGETDTAIRLLQTAVTYQFDLEKEVAEKLEKEAPERLSDEDAVIAHWNRRTARIEIGRIHEGLATCYMQTGLLDEANRVLLKAKDYYARTGYKFGLRAVLPRYFGELYAYLGQSKKARGMFRAGITYSRKRVDQVEKPEMDYVRGMCIDHIAFASMELYLSQVGNARKYTDEAVRYLSILQTQHPARELAIKAEWLVAHLKLTEGNYENAETGLREVLAKCRTLRLVHLEAQVLLSLVILDVKLAMAKAGTAIAVQAQAEGISVAKDALRIVERCRYRILEAQLCYWLAQLYSLGGDLLTALEYAHRADTCSAGQTEDGTFPYSPTSVAAKTLIATLDQKVAGHAVE